MVAALVLLGVALAISLYFNLFGKAAVAAGTGNTSRLETETKSRKDAEAAVEKKNKDLEQLKVQLHELKDELKTAKKKLHDSREADKDGRDLKKAREEAERSASIQLENVRSELAAALAENERMRADRGPQREGRRPAPVAEAQPAQQQPATAPMPAREPVQRVIRELSDADKERMTRLESEARQARSKVVELEKEVRRYKGRVESQNRFFVTTKSELTLVQDKFRALEKRLNRTLLERDLTRRAIKDLERKTGVAAERTELTTEEGAASDKSVEDKQQKEAAEEKAREAERVAQEKAAEAASIASGPSEAPANGTAEGADTQAPANTQQPS